MSIIFHVDANSAFLSWEAVYALQHGATVDYRDVPSVVGGDPRSRRGIVLAKSMPAKAFGIQTGESLYEACKKCPTLLIIKPSHGLYIKCSRGMTDILKTYTTSVDRVSIDECFMEFSNLNKVDYDTVSLANKIKEQIKTELGFTVSIGISENRFLAKMASDFKKPDGVTTLFINEIQEKMWPLPVSDLMMVGRSTKLKLKDLGIYTIGDLANSHPDILKYKFGKQGLLLHRYANGEDDEETFSWYSSTSPMKGIGNSTTTPHDLRTSEDAHLYLLSLSEMVAMRLRDHEKLCGLVSVGIKTSEFTHYSHQRKLSYVTDSTEMIYNEAKSLFDAAWKGEAIRHLGVRVSELSDAKHEQLSMFTPRDSEKMRHLDQTIDRLRLKYGTHCIIRGCFLNSGVQPMTGSSSSLGGPTE